MDDNGTWYPGKDGQWPNNTVRVGKMDEHARWLRIQLMLVRDQRDEARRQLAEALSRFDAYHRDVTALIPSEWEPGTKWQHAPDGCDICAFLLGRVVADPKPKADDEKSEPSAVQERAQRDLAEARKIVWLLIAVVRDVRTNDYPWQNGGKYARLDGWLRKEIER